MIFTGILLATLSGLCNGLFTAPMKMEARWKWENLWAVFIFTSCLAMPWLVVQTTAPGFAVIFRNTPRSAVIAALVFGFAWGFGAICFGRSVDSLGVSIANSLVLGVSSALGSLVPLLMIRPAVSVSGLVLLVGGILAFLSGVALCGAAGRLRDNDSCVKGAKRPSAAGYLFALTSGVLSAVFNIGYTLARPIAHTGVRLGYSQTSATNCIWLLMLGAGAIPNLGYCGFLMSRNRTAFLLLAEGTAASWLRSVGMGVLWGGRIFLYGAATPKLGKLGPSVGWPLSLSVALLVANLMGLMLGEWRRASRRARRRMHQGIVVLLAAILLCSVASRWSEDKSSDKSRLQSEPRTSAASWCSRRAAGRIAAYSPISKAPRL
jgi:L-rhamnose-H+ transport protein